MTEASEVVLSRPDFSSLLGSCFYLPDLAIAAGRLRFCSAALRVAWVTFPFYSMFSLLISVLCSVTIVFIFKYYDRFKVNTFQALVFNYFTCVIVGWLATGRPSLAPLAEAGAWQGAGLVLGGLFIGTFYLVARTAQRVGVSAASVANKMSMVVPVLFNLVVLKLAQRPYTLLNYVGMALALLAILFTALPRRAGAQPSVDATATPTEMAGNAALHHAPTSRAGQAWWLPLLLFLSSGAGDSLLNYTSSKLLPDAATRTLFPLLTFGTAGLIGLLLLAAKVLRGTEKLAVRNVLAGMALGVPNFFSIYFLIQALSAFGNDGAFVYPLANVTVILLGAVGAALLFREQLGGRGRLGLAAATLALGLMSYQEIWGALGW